MAASLEIEIDPGVSSPLTEAEIAAACDLVLREECVERECVVSISLVSDERMHELDLEWRGVDRATDVLSFEMERPDIEHGASPEEISLSAGEPCELGDIVLAPAYVADQAPHFGNDPADEMRLLLVHGMLHLLGYDHIEEADAVRMEAREDELVALLVGSDRVRGGAVTRHGGEDA